MHTLLSIALRNVKRNTRRSLITGAAIFLGIGTQVGVRGFTMGFERTAIANLAEGRIGALTVHHPGYLASSEIAPLQLDLPGDAAFLDRIAAVPGVIAVSPRIVFAASVSFNDETTFANVVGSDPIRDPAALPRATEVIVEGRAVQGQGEALLGSQLAHTLGAKLGDTVTFLAPDRDGVLNGVEAKLVGLLAYKTPGDRRVAQMSLADADQLLRMDGRVTGVAVRVDGPLEGRPLDRARDRVQAALGSSAKVSTWHDIAPWLDDWLLFQKLVFMVVTVVFLLVVLTGITNTMLMSVLERVREIGTMMALGVTRRQLVMLFLAESAFLGFFAGVAGALGGSAVTFVLGAVGFDLPPPGVPLHNIIRPTITFEYNLFAVAVATLGATASAIYPALKASRMRPVEALTHV